jgi:hypothetical protein
MLSVCRANFIDGKRIDQLKFLYQVKYPEQLEILKNKDYVNYLRLMALFYENEKKIDTAQSYFIKAEKEILNNTNLALISKFYLRYGQFFERQKDFGLAVLMYKKSMNYAEKAKLPGFVLDASSCIENLYYENKDFEEAYRYSVQNQKLSNQINNLALKDDLMSLEIENTTKLQALAIEKQELANQIKLEEEEDRKNIFLFSGLLFFIFTIGLSSRLRYIRKSRIELSLEKDKSDNLLLNILPQRVANELKEKGSFAPRAFDQATVLFSDFKNFTQLSATLPVSELIKELDECFKAFDKIIEKYTDFKIEKLTENLSLTAFQGSVSVNEISNSFTKVDCDAKYTNLDFNFNPESKYNLELEAMYGSLNYPEANFEKKSESIINQTTKVKGAYNNAQVSNDALVTINTFQGRVNLK